jgi:DNA-binding transcriptional MerR regulator
MTATLLETSQIPKYSVKQAAEMTGLTLNQVRLWERRYHLVEPQRASNGYRLYCQDDLDILSYALRETQKGVSIQIVAEQVESEREQILEKMRHKKNNALPRILPDDAFRVPRLEQMLQSIQNGNSAQFEQLLVQAQAGRSFAESLRSVDLPVLARIGEMSMHGQLNLSASHLASAVIRRRILAHVQNLGLPHHAPPVLLACIPDDYHELGLLCCMLELTQKQIATLYFGANVPIAELEQYARKVNPPAILLSVVAPLRDSEAQKLVQNLQQGLSKIAPLAVGGYEAERRRHLFEHAGIKVFRQVEDILQWSYIRHLAQEN